MEVKINIAEEEAKAFFELLEEAKVSPVNGYALTMLKFKIFSAFKAADEQKTAANSKPPAKKKVA